MKKNSLQLSLRFSLSSLLLSLFLNASLSLSAQVFSGDLDLYTQAEVDAFSYTEITGNFRVLGFNINHLDALSPLTAVGGSLEIRSTSLVNLDGLSSLTAVGGNLSIYFNDALTNLDGLSSLTSVGGFVTIDTNPSLTDLDGLSSLTSVGGDLYIYENPALAGFCGLYPLLNGGWTSSLYYVIDNLDNPSQSDILAGGPCTQNPAQLIAGLLADGTFNQGQANALNTKLNNCRLNAFNNLANAWVNAGILTQQQADDLIAAAAQHCAPPTRIAAPQAFSLGQNYPNPASSYSVIPFTLSASGKVSIQLYDATGKMVRNLLDQYLTAGTHEVKVNLQSVSAGTYFYKFQVGEEIETLPMVVE